MALVFVNKKTYPIQVPTPSGGGRILQPGYACSGDFFLSVWRAGVPITKLTDAEIAEFNPDFIVLTLNTIGNASIMPERVEQSPEKARLSQPVIVAPPVKKQSMEDQLEEAMGNLSTMLPTPDEVKKLNTLQLNEVATKLGISSNGGTRKQLVDMIVNKLNGKK